MTTTIYVGDCKDVLPTLPANSVQCVVTSPPYFGLRDYGVDGQCGLEPTSDEYVDNMVAVFREVRRVMRNDAVLFLNLGDSYQDKQLQGIPWRVAFALQADGWVLRSDIIWSKPNCMPESVTDRPTKSHEYVFLLTKSKTYFYDSDAIRDLSQDSGGGPPRFSAKCTKVGKHDGSLIPYERGSGRNKRTVWTVSTKGFPGAHFAVMPTALVEPMVKAGTSERGCCPACGSPWERLISTKKYEPPMVEAGVRNVDNSRGDKTRKLDGKSKEWRETAASRETVGWRPTCTCGVDVDSGALDPNTGAGIDVRQPFEPIPCTVLDIFAGAGTVGLVADRLQRDAILIELNPEYAEMARRRIEGEAPMFTSVAVERV